MIIVSHRHDGVVQVSTQMTQGTTRHEDQTRPPGAVRRSELVALDVEDLQFDPARGLLPTIRRSKTNQEQAEPKSPSRTSESKRAR
jgi:hypothetical protein